MRRFSGAESIRAVERVARQIVEILQGCTRLSFRRGVYMARMRCLLIYRRTSVLRWDSIHPWQSWLFSPHSGTPGTRDFCSRTLFDPLPFTGRFFGSSFSGLLL
jgi:hypothetical protein